MDKPYALIISPYKSNFPSVIKANEEIAESMCRLACSRGYVPIATHIYCTRFLHDTVAYERRLGLQIESQLLKDLNIKYAFMLDVAITEGMEKAFDECTSMGIPVELVKMSELNPITNEPIYE